MNLFFYLNYMDQSNVLLSLKFINGCFGKNPFNASIIDNGFICIVEDCVDWLHKLFSVSFQLSQSLFKILSHLVDRLNRVDWK